jgi:hypothetical protein
MSFYLVRSCGGVLGFSDSENLREEIFVILVDAGFIIQGYGFETYF